MLYELISICNNHCNIYLQVMKRYSSFLGWLGIPPWLHSDYPPGECCKVVSEFTLKYRNNSPTRPEGS